MARRFSRSILYQPYLHNKYLFTTFVLKLQVAFFILHKLDIYSCFSIHREYGEKWHKDGSFGKKQNVFDDFIAAAEYLINMNYTSPEK